MASYISSFQIPEKVLVDPINPYTSLFTFGPLEPGFGVTLGNCLRRTLLSALEGYAITHVKLPDGTLHEFGTIEGVAEDMSEVILNLKKVRFKELTPDPASKIEMHIANQKTLTAGDLIRATGSFEILNPELVICHMDESASFTLELNVQKGRGYLPAEENQPLTDVVGYIAIDAIFTPIKNVKLSVQNTLVGQKTDYEKLIIEISTDGSLTPHAALQKAGSTLLNFFSLIKTEHIFSSVPAAAVELSDDATEDSETLRIRKLLRTPLAQLGLSARAYNSLWSNDITLLGDIVKLSLEEVMKLRNIGKKSLEELEQLVAKHNLSFGMQIPAA